jgi:hypothetical protein
MEPQIEPKHVKVIKACALYVFPAIIVILLALILLIPAPKNGTPKDVKAIDAEIQRLLQEKTKILNQ